jgi:intracellular sulfur oxidation DsrE/DsrF family protein
MRLADLDAVKTLADARQELIDLVAAGPAVTIFHAPRNMRAVEAAQAAARREMLLQVGEIEVQLLALGVVVDTDAVAGAAL